VELRTASATDLITGRNDRIISIGRLRALEPGVLEQTLLRARALLQANVGDEAPWRRTTRQASATEGSKLWVYRRRQQPCFRCGDGIRMKRQGQALRSTYFCPTCQRVSPEALAALFAPKLLRTPEP
jgi:hypothetical protein